MTSVDPPASNRSRTGGSFADEAALVARLRRGDAEAFEELVRTHGGRLLAVARRLLRDEEDARDAVQEGFLAAYRSLGQFEGGCRIATWMHRIVVNASLMKLRTKRRKPEEPIEALLPRFLEDGHHASHPGDWYAPADELLEQVQARALVRRAVDELPETYRTVLLLRDIEELDTAETAALLGIGENAVKTRLHRARQALRALLDPHLRRGTA